MAKATSDFKPNFSSKKSAGGGSVKAPTKTGAKSVSGTKAKTKKKGKGPSYTKVSGKTASLPKGSTALYSPSKGRLR